MVDLKDCLDQKDFAKRGFRIGKLIVITPITVSRTPLCPKFRRSASLIMEFCLVARLDDGWEVIEERKAMK